MLLLWIRGKINGVRILYRDVEKNSENLIDLKEDAPLELSRKSRSLEDIEFRQILLYTGLLVFKNVLRNEKYTHFLSVHVAIRINAPI